MVDAAIPVGLWIITCGTARNEQLGHTNKGAVRSLSLLVQNRKELGQTKLQEPRPSRARLCIFS